MIQSMTGFGRIESTLGQTKIISEIKSLNSKSLDLTTKIPYKFKDKEIIIRRLISEKLIRGKIDFYLSVENSKEISDSKLNTTQIQFYINDLKEILPNQLEIEYLKIAMKLPNSIHVPINEEQKDEWEEILNIICKNIETLVAYRNKEGEILQKELISRINNILNLLSQIEIFESERIKTTKDKIESKFAQSKIEIDKNRFEQEMIYYLEKLDITEEKLRLESNCNYFLEEMYHNNTDIGKKLGFISQEIGREINTLGSKSNQKEMQKIVVNMKDELEKVKEQLLNVL